MLILGDFQNHVECLRRIIVGTVGVEVELISVLISSIVENLSVIIQESTLGSTFTSMLILILLLEFWVNVEVDRILLHLLHVLIAAGGVESVVLHWDNTSPPKMYP